MSANTDLPTPRNPTERLELARQLYREYRVRCFWHSPQDLEITEGLIPFVAKGLRHHGGWRGFLLASKLLPPRAEGQKWIPKMPLTPFQQGVARVLAANRNPESHIAGGAVVNRGEAGLRISDDLDIFHDAAALVAGSAATDEKSLLAAGYAVTWVTREAAIMKAEVTRDGERVHLDWTTDSAFRFFPAQPDEEFGYCLHPADLATNKILALAGRSEPRDYLDVLLIDQNYLSLGAMAWAACGKDQGFTPPFLLNQANQHSRYQEDDFRGETLVRPIDLKELKRQWISARERAERLFEQLPAEEIGCLYLDAGGNPITPDPTSPEFVKLTRHFGSIRGTWPKMS